MIRGTREAMNGRWAREPRYRIATIKHAKIELRDQQGWNDMNCQESDSRVRRAAMEAYDHVGDDAPDGDVCVCIDADATVLDERPEGGDLLVQAWVTVPSSRIPPRRWSSEAKLAGQPSSE